MGSSGKSGGTSAPPSRRFRVGVERGGRRSAAFEGHNAAAGGGSR